MIDSDRNRFYVTVKEFAERTKISKQAVRDMFHHKILEGFKFGKSWVIPISELRKYLKSRVKRGKLWSMRRKKHSS